MNAAEREHLQSDLVAEQLDVARLRAALAGEDDPLADFKPPADADPTLISTQRSFAQPDGRAACEDCRARPAAGAEGSRTRHDRGHHRQARGDHSVVQQRVEIRKT